MVRFIGEFGKFGERPGQDGRLDAPAFHRNHQPIWSVLSPFLHGKSGDVLEVGSGTGQHIVEFARHAPDLVWWPSDNDRMHLESIAAWRLRSKLPNVRQPSTIDLSEYGWKLPRHETPGPSQLLAILCINVLHIAAWRVSESLLGGAARYLRPDGRVFVYGPFMRNGKHTAPSNAAFDGYLRGSNVEWGVRDVEALAASADRVDLTIAEVVDMPANNLILIFERTAKIMRNVLPAAREVVDRAERIVLSERDSVRVLELLENPPKPTPALMAAARRRAPRKPETMLG